MNVVKAYMEGRCKEGECGLPVVYGLYGSGKTTLLVELCRWCLEHGIPALRVNLSEVVGFIRGLGIKRVSEDELPKYFEQFYQERLKSLGLTPKRGVLIVDEVEEAYEELKKLVGGVSILRGLADKVRTGALGVLVVLGFAPTSVLHEAVLQYATAWRVRTVAVPSAPVDYIYRGYTKGLQLSNKLERFRIEIRELLANTAWWLSKGGRLGWVEMLHRNRVLEGAVRTLNYLAEGYSIRDIGLCFEPPEDRELSETVANVLRAEPVKGVQLFDREFYRRMLEDVRKGFEYSEGLVKVLTCLSGPVSSSLLNALSISIDPYYRVPERYVVKGSEVVDLDVLVEVYIEALRRVSRGVTQQLESSDIAKAREYLSTVLKPWSAKNLIIYDKEELKLLLGEMLQLLLIERLEHKLLDLSMKVDLDAVLEEARRRTVEKGIRVSEYLYALRVETLRNLLPPVLVQPLIACSKGKDADVLLRELRRYYNLQDYLRRDPELDEVLRKYNLSLYVIMVPEHFDSAVRSIKDNIIEGGGITFLLLTELTKDLELREKVKKEFEGLLNRTVFILDPPPILALFIAGLLYSYIKCPQELERISGLEAVIYRMGRSSLRELLSDMGRKYLEFRGFITDVVRKELDSVFVLELLRKRAHATVGEANARYLWTIAAIDDARSYLSELISALKQLFDTAENICKSISKNPDAECDLTRGFKGLLEHGVSFLNDSHRGLLDILSKSSHDNLGAFLEFLRNMLRFLGPECRDGPYEFIEELVSRSILSLLPEPHCRVLVSKYLSDAYETMCVELKEFPETLSKLRTNVGMLRNSFESLLEKLTEVYKRLGLSKSLETTELEALKVTLEDLGRKASSLIRSFDELSKYGRTLIKLYLDEQLKEAPARLDDLRKLIEEGAGLALKASSYLREAEKLVEELKELNVKEAFEEDLRSLTEILVTNKVALPRLSNLETFEKELEKYVGKLRKLKEEIKDVQKYLYDTKECVDFIEKVLRGSSR